MNKGLRVEDEAEKICVTTMTVDPKRVHVNEIHEDLGNRAMGMYGHVQLATGTLWLLLHMNLTIHDSKTKQPSKHEPMRTMFQVSFNLSPATSIYR